MYSSGVLPHCPRTGYIQLFIDGLGPGNTLSLDCQNVPSFLIDTRFDEVSQTGSQECHCFTEFRTCFMENLGCQNMPSILIECQQEVKTVPKQCQNSAYRYTDLSPLQQRDELHQKDLRINLDS